MPPPDRGGGWGGEALLPPSDFLPDGGKPPSKCTDFENLGGAQTLKFQAFSLEIVRKSPNFLLLAPSALAAVFLTSCFEVRATKLTFCVRDFESILRTAHFRGDFATAA